MNTNKNTRKIKPFGQPQIEVLISVFPHRRAFAWSFIVHCYGRKPVIKWGLLSRSDYQSAERVWLHTLSLAYEWRDRFEPNARLIIRPDEVPQGRKMRAA